MSKFSLALAAGVTLLMSQLAQGGFTLAGATEDIIVTRLGNFSVPVTTVNKFNAQGSMITTEQKPESLSDFTDTMSAGSYNAYLVNVRDPGQSYAEVSFDNRIAGLVASNGWEGTDPNVWGGIGDENGANTGYGALYDAIVAVVLDGITDPADQEAKLQSLFRDGPASTEVGDRNSGPNPDMIFKKNDKTLTYASINTDFFGSEYSLVFTIPEPGTIAVWSLCGLCGLVAGRRRLKQVG